LAAHGKGSIAISHTSSGGPHLLHHRIDPAEASMVHYLFEDGYLLAGPSQALLDAHAPAAGLGR